MKSGGPVRALLCGERQIYLYLLVPKTAPTELNQNTSSGQPYCICVCSGVINYHTTLGMRKTDLKITRTNRTYSVRTGAPVGPSSYHLLTYWTE
ncbi:hypothetical protein L873DRAFT_1450697 [Choiromyces venosus 120613-1]|uniref:Uncharacterized protein n=1 Tax=Choiromyces venosus 120613-1 TaxID=1336337 RepID=A0A3N4K4L4_9PEZI|nr:hypothetical protein L873DRAFT_1450697 [Choiromyces venosus 120613-1]